MALVTAIPNSSPFLMAPPPGDPLGMGTLDHTEIPSCWGVVGVGCDAWTGCASSIASFLETPLAGDFAQILVSFFSGQYVS